MSLSAYYSLALLVPDGAPPAQEILPGLFENQQQFYGPIVTTAYGIAAPLLSNEQAFHAPTVTAGAVVLLPPLLENEQQFYQATVGQPPLEEQEQPPPPTAAVGVPWRDRGPAPISELDDRDLLEILPIVIGALNASRTY